MFKTLSMDPFIPNWKHSSMIEMTAEAFDALAAVAATSVASTSAGSYAGISKDVNEDPVSSLPEFWEMK